MGKKVRENISVIIAFILCLITILGITATQSSRLGVMQTKIEVNAKEIEDNEGCNREDHKAIAENQKLISDDLHEALGHLEAIRGHIIKSYP